MNNFTSTNFLDKVRKAICDYSMPFKNSRILVALSGGADSCALLICLKNLSGEYGFSLGAVHVNHSIRQQEAKRDMLFSKALCEKHGISFFCETVDVPALAKRTGLSLELEARNQRYKIFEKICKENSFDCVTLAHTASDNAETVIFNLARGSAIGGLCGIPAVRDLCNGVLVARPLIYVTRNEVELYLKELSQDFVTDSTNNSDDYTRNFIRHNIIPSLKEINPSLENTLTKTSKMLKSDNDFLEKFAKQNLTDNVSKLKMLDDAILSRVIKLLYCKKFDSTLESVHISAITELIRKAPETSNYSSINLPQNTKAIIENQTLRFEDASSEHTNYNFSFKAQIGENFIPDSKFALFIDTLDKEPCDTLCNNKIIYKKYNTVSIYFDKLNDNLHICSRHDGDKFKFKSFNRLVKRLINANKIPLTLRINLPFVKVNDEIAYIPFVGVGDNFNAFSDKRKTKANISFYIEENSFPRSNL